MECTITFRFRCWCMKSRINSALQTRMKWCRHAGVYSHTPTAWHSVRPPRSSVFCPPLLWLRWVDGCVSLLAVREAWHCRVYRAAPTTDKSVLRSPGREKKHRVLVLVTALRYKSSPCALYCVAFYLQKYKNVIFLLMSNFMIYFIYTICIIKFSFWCLLDNIHH